jgi:two-component system chemotaxis response regulator CheY
MKSFLNMQTSTRVLSIGQCGFDHSTIARLFDDRFGIRVDGADDLEDAESQLAVHDYGLILVNRKLDSDGGSGLAVLSKLVEGHPGVPVMLVSNLADAQRDAVQKGALPGFGKAELHNDATLTLLRDALKLPAQ